MTFLEVLATPDEMLSVQEMILGGKTLFYLPRVPKLLQCVASASVVSPGV